MVPWPWCQKTVMIQSARVKVGSPIALIITGLAVKLNQQFSALK